MKTAGFNEMSVRELSDSINNWTDKNKDKKVVDIKYCLSASGTWHCALVLYKNLKEERKDKLDNLNDL